MPCRSYEDENGGGWYESFTRQQAISNKLARIACISLQAVEEMYDLMPNDQKDGTHVGRLLQTVLQNKEVMEWWPGHKIADAAEKAHIKKVEAEKAAAATLKKKRAALIAKMPEEERKILGLK